jgi:hypothetical protein
VVYFNKPLCFLTAFGTAKAYLHGIGVNLSAINGIDPAILLALLVIAQIVLATDT